MSCAVMWSGLLIASPLVHGETMSGALSLAYKANPNLNQQRAGLRATDENLPRALALGRPTASGTVGYGPVLGSATGGSSLTVPLNVGLTASQTLFNGGRTETGIRQAETGILQGREALRSNEQSTLLNSAGAYMDVLRDTAILGLNRNNIIVLEQQLRQTLYRYKILDVTRTDVAQAETSLANARAGYFTAQANLQTSIANFRQFIGVRPTSLEPARPIAYLLPRTLDLAVEHGLLNHPDVQGALHSVDSAALQIKLVEGELYPTVALAASTQYAMGSQGSASQMITSTVLGQATIPIYDGGEVYARARQAKDLLTQARHQADLQRDIVRANIVSTWASLISATSVIASSRSAVGAAESALSGVRDEARAGQRTTLDILNAQQALLTARIGLVGAEHDRVVASYAAVAAIGELSAAALALKVSPYDPTLHFDQIKDKLVGLRTPDGR